MKKISILFIFLLAAAAAFADGTFNFGTSAGTGDGWSFNGQTLTITANGTFTFTGGSNWTYRRIVVQPGLTNVNITLDNAHVGNASASAFDMTGTTVNLTLVGANTLFGDNNNAGLRAPEGSTLVISGTGSLTATACESGAGIGGSADEAGGTITINSGTITAISGYNCDPVCIRVIPIDPVQTIGGTDGYGYGAGIGGGDHGAGGRITINGGTVNAISGGAGAGIGGGSGGAGGRIDLNGGTVTAKSGYYGDGGDGSTTGSNGAGIGGGDGGDGGIIYIENGCTVNAIGGHYAAGIGGGKGGNGASFNLINGTVTATAGEYGAGIGGGYDGDGGKFAIYGGSSVNATGGNQGAGIGGGTYGSGGSIVITSYGAGTVSATTSGGVNGGAGIGGGWNGSGGTIVITSDNVTATPGGGAETIGHGAANSDSGNQIVLIGPNASANMKGNVTLPANISIPGNKTLTILAGQTLTVPADITLTNSGRINNCAGTIINNGTITGNPVSCPATVSHAITLTVNKDGAAWSGHGKTFTLRQDGVRYTGVGADGTVVFHAINGTYNIFDGDTDTGTSVTVSGATAGATINYYPVTLTVNRNGAAWSGHGKTFTLRQGGTVKYTGTGTGGAVTFTGVVNGTYDIFDGSADTGADVTVSSAAANAALNYYTVAFFVGARTNASATIAATYDGVNIDYGTAVVLGGKELIVTVTPAGANSYAYAWTGTGTSSETTASITVNPLASAVDAVCAVTGTYQLTGGTVGITGTPSVDSTLTASVSGLTTNPAGKPAGTLSYQWKRNGVDIAGETAATYILVAADPGASITVTVTAANCTGSITSAAITVPPPALTPVLDPSAPPLTGDTVALGDTVTLAVTVLPPADGGTLSYQWYAAPDTVTPGTAIAGANEDTYAAPTDNAGTTWYYVVVSNTLGNTATLTVAAVPVTAVAPPPTEISGQPQPPLEGPGTPDDPFTGDVNTPIDDATLTPDDIYTGDDDATVIFYDGPDYTTPSHGVDLYPDETVRVYFTVTVNGVTYYYALDVTRTPEVMPSIRRSVTLPPIDGAVTDPPAGAYRLNSGSDFVFTVTPIGTGLHNSAPPLVRTDRAGTPDDVLVTPNADGTYTVRVYAIHSDITLNIDFSVINANTDVAAAKVWSYGHTLYVSAPTAGTARIYNLAGQLVKAIPYTAGETVQAVLPSGTYIVAANGRTYKVVIGN